ncbi:DUF2071 domain-containing protein [Stieleria sp. TO1_6]|uniref:DUF2071 domain-containing protein n=1 Tax=Stieleria tagensis TaxID=2956795 RepID=UPI00209AC47C|nr:DUF2071 domain-containing protein [Stieleria tagensis]MCO8122665.1 DUF2071 domain-containing protein [Stieleria tagensis]
MIRLPAIRGIIDRRILANYCIDVECMAAVLPPPFRPWCVAGKAIGGICLIRLKQLRPRWLPVPWGLRSENAAHRIAVQWDSDQGIRRGVYIPRRDTDSRLNSIVGGRLFPGIHHHARFDVRETEDQFSVTMTRDDGHANVHVAGRVASEFPAASVFDDVEAASEFFAAGSVGYSDTASPGRFDGLELRCANWRVEPLVVSEIQSGFFDDHSRFPAGSVTFDNALLMRQIDHQWHGHPDLCC